MSRRPGARRAAARRPALPPARRAWGALLVALGLMLAQGPMLLHLLLVRHVACEHGELVERIVPAVSREAGAIRESDAAPDRLEASAAGSDHDHCDVLAVRHRPGDVAPAVGAALLMSIAPRASLCPRGETRPVPLLSLAPKSSPPAA